MKKIFLWLCINTISLTYCFSQKDTIILNRITKSYDILSGWASLGRENGLSQGANCYTQNFAARLETENDECGKINSSGTVSGLLQNYTDTTTGIPYTRMSDTLYGFYKYVSIGNDTVTINLSLTKNGFPVGGNSKWLTPIGNYTYFEIPFQVFSIPDTLRINIRSSEWSRAPVNIEKSLYLDNLWMKSDLQAAIEKEMLESTFYPNPVKDIIYIEFKKNVPEIMNLFIYDSNGITTQANETSRNANSLIIDVSNLALGIYYYEIRTPEGIMRNKFMKE